MMAICFVVLAGLAGLVFATSWTVTWFVHFTIPGTFWDFFCSAARSAYWPSLFTFATSVVCAYVFNLPDDLYAGPEKTRVIYLRERKEAIYENLRDLNFEFKAGKFPDSDYQTMKTSLEEEAAAVLAEIARLEEAAATAPLPRKGARV